MPLKKSKNFSDPLADEVTCGRLGSFHNYFSMQFHDCFYSVLFHIFFCLIYSLISRILFLLLLGTEIGTLPEAKS